MKRARVVPTMQFIPAITPRYSEPRHLAPIIEVLERTEREPVLATFSVPPRHEKTETLMHYGARRLLIDPATRIMWVSYGQRISEKKSRRMRELAKRAGVPLSDDSKAKADWRTGVDEGGCWATSPGGSIVGEGADLILCDDLIRGRADAESAVERDNLWEWFISDLITRLEPGGSIVVNGHRFHVDDIIARCNAHGYQHVKLAALNDAGEALFPERWPADVLVKKRETMGEYAFSGLYMQEPRARGGELFKGTYFYSTLPEGVQFGIGVDLAYSKKTHADYSVAVVLAKKGDTFYVVQVVRGQVGAPAFAATLKSLSSRYGGARVHWFCSTTEIGLADLMREQSGIPIRGELATVDKFMRAQRVAAVWNAEKILLPREATWLEDFVSELLDFTGVADRHDDQIDALASAHRAVFRDPKPPGQAPPGLSLREVSSGPIRASTFFHGGETTVSRPDLANQLAGMLRR